MKYPELITPVKGQVYLNHNGQHYHRINVTDPEYVVMERISDHWMLPACRVRQFEDGSIEWDQSINFHWPNGLGGQQKIS